jgi:hypothetical protein
MPFEYQGLGYKVVYSLSDKIRIAEEHMEVGIISELEDVDHGEFHDKLRKVQPEFGDGHERHDVQMIFDENLVNHLLLALHSSTKTYSLRELLVYLIPEKYKKFMVKLQGLLQTTMLGHLIPQILEELPKNKQVDIKCGLSKNFLSGSLDHLAALTDVHASQISFREGNRVDF